MNVRSREGMLETFGLALTPAASGMVVYQKFPVQSCMLVDENSSLRPVYDLLDVLISISYKGEVRADDSPIGTVTGKNIEAFPVSGRVLVTSSDGMWTIERDIKQSLMVFPVFPSIPETTKVSITQVTDKKTIEAENRYMVPLRWAEGANESGTRVTTYLLVESDSRGYVLTNGKDQLNSFRTGLRSGIDWSLLTRGMADSDKGNILAMTTEVLPNIEDNYEGFVQYLQAFIPEHWVITQTKTSVGYPVYQLVEQATTSIGTKTYQVPVDCLVTAVVSDFYEVPVAKKTLDLAFTDRFSKEYYIGFSVSSSVPSANSGQPSGSLITGYRLYVREWKVEETKFEEQSNEDYQQIASFSYLREEQKKSSFGRYDANGIYLSQRLGYSYLKGEEAFRTISHFTEVNGLYFALSGNQVISSAVGAGSIQPFVFHKQNVIPNITSKRITKLANVNGSLAVFTETEMTLIASQDIGGAFIHSVKDTIGFGAADRWDVVSSSDATVISTPHGIYATNGSSTKLLNPTLLAEMMRDWRHLDLFYSEFRKELYVQHFKDGVSFLYVYSFIEEAWTTISTEQPFSGIAEFDGDTYFRLKDGYYLASFSDRAEGFYRTPRTSLRAPNMMKSACYVTFDCEGEITVWGNTYECPTRRYLTVAVPTAERTPSRTLQLEFFLENARVYSATFNYDAIGERPFYDKSVSARQEGR